MDCALWRPLWWDTAEEARCPIDEEKKPINWTN